MMRRLLPVTLIVLLLVMEGLIKTWAVAALTPGTDRVLVPGLLHLGFTLNLGMAWGLLGGLPAPLGVLRLLVGLAIVTALLIGRLAPTYRWPLALIAAGALGNGLDGLIRGAVVDYLTMPTLDGVSTTLSGRDFPIFNLSDVLVCTGTVWLLLASWKTGQKAEQRVVLNPQALNDTSKENP